MHTAGGFLRRVGVFALAAAVFAGSTSASVAAPPEERGERLPLGVRGGTPDVSVTLLTGDRVVLAGGDPRQVVVEPGRGRGKAFFHGTFVDGHLYVVPSDVRRQVDAGVLDRRLFDVTGLVEAKYDDRSAEQIPLIVSYQGAATRKRLAAAGATALQVLPAVDGTALEVDKATAATFFDSIPLTAEGFGGEIERIWLDGKANVLLDESVGQVGAPAAWEAGLTGAGVRVGVLDTGVDAGHPDLAGKVLAAKDFSGQGPGDGNGHGTHVASTIAGTAAASGGRYQGVAPGARLLDGKVCENDGYCPESMIIAGMEWAATEQDADVINLSLGIRDTPGIGPMEAAVDSLTASTGALFVAAAGNEGPERSTLRSPGSADAALTVGAVDKADELADISSRGPRLGDGAIKPDITAPGVDITAARAERTSAGDPVDENYTTISGTSMATPHVAGAAALLVQQHPDWSAAQLKGVLMGSATPHSALTAFEQGAGRVDVARSITQSVFAEPGSIAFGTVPWPHDDDEPVARRLTYRNSGDQPVTLNLSVTATGPDGEPALAGTVSLSASTLTVPAGGNASVTVTSNTAHAGPDGVYSGRTTATYGTGGRVVTPFTVEKEAETYTLTLEGRDRTGQPTEFYAGVFGLDTTVAQSLRVEDGRTQLRLPKGDYTVDGIVLDGANGVDGASMLVQPMLRLDRNLTWVADARQAKPVSVTVQNPDVSPAQVVVSYEVEGAAGIRDSHLWADSFDGLHTAQLGPELPGAFRATIGADWGVEDADGSRRNSPQIYKLADGADGRFWDGYQKRLQDGDLATVVRQFNAQVARRSGYAYMFGSVPSGGPATSARWDFDLPAKTTVHFSGGQVRWRQTFNEFVVDPDDGSRVDVTELEAPERTYRRGGRYAEQWNAAVFGPGPTAAARAGDSLAFAAPLYSDQEGNAGVSSTDSGSTVLYRNGERIAESPYAGQLEVEGLAPEAADFVVEATAERATYSDLSTTQKARWTFRSAATDPAEEAPLPIWTGTFHPRVDANNVNHDTTIGFVPLKLTSADRSGAGTIRDVTVMISFDDGESWRQAALVPAGPNAYLVLVTPPEGARYVSLRLAAEDTRRNAVEQTIIRAYRLG